MPPVADSLQKFGTSFQTKVITCLLVDDEFIQTIYDMIQPEQLDTEAKQWIVKEIKSSAFINASSFGVKVGLNPNTLVFVLSYPGIVETFH